MCGIAGFWLKNNVTDGSIEESMRQMVETLHHRGPDYGATWYDSRQGIALGHRRLSVLDLSPKGNQPMKSKNGRFILVFNGEIYNFLELKFELEKSGFNFFSSSDTEVVLAAFEKWGVKGSLGRFNGMFALAVWDQEERKMYLARDRMGEKPLYYGFIGNAFVFASELKAIKKYLANKLQIDRNSLTLFFRHNYIPAPYTIYKNIFKLLPANCAEIDFPGADIRLEEYWSIPKRVGCNIKDSFRDSESSALDRLETILRDSVKMRMVSDVPIGVFLSSGIDSSLIATMMQQESSEPIKTFTIGFSESRYDEAPLARETAKFLKTDHTEIYVTPEEAMSTIADLPNIYDEPFSDSSQIPTCLISRVARKEVAVSLSGDGGDELFGGYNLYFEADKIWRSIGRIPQRLRPGISKFLEKLAGFGGSFFKKDALNRKIELASEFLNYFDSEIFYRRMVSHWKSPQDLVKGGKEYSTRFLQEGKLVESDSLVGRMMYIDCITYLPDDILVKLDRASMAVGLEARVPLLDHRLVEFVMGLPTKTKTCLKDRKKMLKGILKKYMPLNLTDRPKAGFTVPIGKWLRGPLVDWAENLLDESTLRRQGYLDSAAVGKMWREHKAGKKDWYGYLWDVLMFQLWLEAE